MLPDWIFKNELMAKTVTITHMHTYFVKKHDEMHISTLFEITHIKVTLKIAYEHLQYQIET